MSRSMLLRLLPLPVILLFAAFLYVSPQDHQVFFRDNGTVDSDREEQYWERRIPEAGRAAAYQELADGVDGLIEVHKHVAAHAFGEALWATESWEGADVCDERFSFGCWHSYIAGAILQLGLTEGALAVSKQCETYSDTSRSVEAMCWHGIGHGITAYLGYDPADIKAELEECDKLPHASGSTPDCYGGVVMEYNFRSHSSESLRPLTESNRYAPCLSLSGLQKTECMYWQPLWWFVALHDSMDMRTLFSTLGNYCMSDKLTPALSTACIQGIGFLAPGKLERDPLLTAKACMYATQTGPHRISCWSYAVDDLDARLSEIKSNICDGLLDEDLRYCTEHQYDVARAFNRRVLP